MSLATRCSACNTVFRVVQDQLKVSEGWVRCGRCQEVFNALEGLFDLEPEPVAPPVETPQPAVDVEPATAPVEAVADEAPSTPVDFDATPASRVAPRDREDFADAKFNSELLAEAGIEGPESASEDTPAAEPVAPEFLLRAERQARWERPRTVVGLSVLTLLLLFALTVQTGLQLRDWLAAVAPPLRPALDALCEWADCRIEPLRRIDDVAIESSALTSSPGGDAVRLSLVLRNRGALALAMPSIELTLTDAGGQTIVRRALSPAEFGVANAVLTPGAESALQLVASTGARRATGYTVEPFYP